MSAALAMQIAEFRFQIEAAATLSAADTVSAFAQSFRRNLKSEV
jgi:hypothetical protein